MMPPLAVTRTADPPGDWPIFAAAHGTFYHRVEWAECLRKIYGFPLQCFSARASGQLQGLLATAEVPALFGPRRLVSLPFSYAAGPLANDQATAAALADAARAHARELGIGRVELKSRGEHPPAPGYQRTAHYSTYEVPTDGGEAELWGRLHRGSTQRSIRKAQKAGLLLRRADTVDDWLIMAQ